MTTELPAEAIEAAAIALFDDNPAWHLVYDRPALWPEVAEPAKERYREQATAALTAAAPFIRAQALEDAAMDFPADLPEFADLGADGLIDYISVEDWLNTRAKQERGEG